MLRNFVDRRCFNSFLHEKWSGLLYGLEYLYVTAILALAETMFIAVRRLHSKDK
jgi:hypothetical protein